MNILSQSYFKNNNYLPLNKDVQHTLAVFPNAFKFNSPLLAETTKSITLDTMP